MPATLPFLVVNKINSYLIPDWIEREVIKGAYLFILEPLDNSSYYRRLLNLILPTRLVHKILRYIPYTTHQTVFCHHSNDYYYQLMVHFLITTQRLKPIPYLLHISYDPYHGYFSNLISTFYANNAWKWQEKRRTITYEPSKFFLPQHSQK